jgi:hypothetical protein
MCKGEECLCLAFAKVVISTEGRKEDDYVFRFCAGVGPPPLLRHTSHCPRSVLTPNLGFPERTPTIDSRQWRHPHYTHTTTTTTTTT